MKLGRLAVAVVLLAAGCSSSTPPPAAADPDVPTLCLTEATVGAAVGFAVHVERPTIKQNADAVNCTFMADDQAARPGANVGVLVAPAVNAERARADIVASAREAGVATVAVAVGDNGVAYESAQRSAAATVVQGKLIAVTIDGMGLSSPGAGRAAAIALVGRIVEKVRG